MANPISDCITGVATNLSQKLLVDPIVKEAHYLCCYGTYVENFQEKRKTISATRDELQSQIDDARRRNQTLIKPEVQQWLGEANGLITEDIETKKKCFCDWCPNFIWQYKRGKALEKKTLRIGELKESFKSLVDNGVARPAKLPDSFYIKNFVEIKSRESEFKSLEEALKDESCYMVGLHGMGGTGKTTMAKQVANKVEESKVFDKVIFVVVSTPPNFKNMRDEIGKRLLEEGKEADSDTLLKRIDNYEGKLLIILDDVWEKFGLEENVGIPSQYNKKNFTLLITTRDSWVCNAMGCDRLIQLRTLEIEEALNLFLIYAGKNRDSSRDQFKHVAKEIVGKCGGLPVAIVALASALKNRPIGEWKSASTTLQKAEQLQDAPEDMIDVYRSLRLSYEKLRNEKAKELLLLCSLFPVDTEIRVEDLIRFGIGLGLFGEVDQHYAVRRNKVIEAKRELLDSSLLLEGEEENCVKMHDLVRDVALWMKKKGIEAIIDSKKTLKGKLQYLWWKSDNGDFPNQFDVTNLEILFLWIEREDGLVELPNEFFAKMKNLKVLQYGGSTSQTSPPSSLLESLQALKDIQTLILSKCALGDISILGNLPSLETLELKYCSVRELPKEIKKLKKLRLLGLRGCQIERNNPFEVIEACPELEELYFVGNEDVDDWRPQDEAKIEDAVVENRSPPKLQRYYVSLKTFDEIDGPRSRCFNPTGMKDLISEVTFNDLLKRAEILELGNIEGTGWTNVIPDVVPINNEEMDNLVNLSLNSLANVKCLVDTNSIPNLTAFSMLHQLSLEDVDVEELYSGVMPHSFLMELDFLCLEACKNLHSVLFKGDYNLCHLKIMSLRDCPGLKSIFQVSSAQSLKQLEVLIIRGCCELECIIEGGDAQQSGGAQLFPKLETLEVKDCHKLELILPFLSIGDLPVLKAVRIKDCEGLKYIFGEYIDEKRGLNQNEQEESMLPSLEAIQMRGIPNLISIFREGYKWKPLSSEMASSSGSRHPKSATSALCWRNLCCFVPTTKRPNDIVSKVTLPDHRISQELHQTYTHQCLIQTLDLKYLKKIRLDGNLPNLKWVFTLSIATSILVEELMIFRCHGLESIIRKEEEHDQMNCCSIFPKLEELSVSYCSNLEIMFPSPFPIRLEKLKSLTVRKAPALICVFWECQLHNNHAGELPSNDVLQNHLPALDELDLSFVPKMISVCSHQAAEELHQTYTEQCLIQTLDLKYLKEIRLDGLHNLKWVFTLSIATSILVEELMIVRCHGLESILRKEEEHDQMNCCSIFPKLEKFSVSFCNNLEIMFPSPFPVRLEKLKSLTVKNAPALICVFWEYQLHNNHAGELPSNDELHNHLPALDDLSLVYVPKMMSVCSHQAAEESFASVNQIQIFQDLWKQSFNLTNIKKIYLEGFPSLKSLFTPSVATSMIALEELGISCCDGVEHIVTMLGEDHHHHRDPCSIFPKLESLVISQCRNLEIMFPSTFSVVLEKLKSVSIYRCRQLKYIFGKYEDTNSEDYISSNANMNINLPALEELKLREVPDMMGFYGSKSQLHISPSFFDLMFCSHTPHLSSETTQESSESNKGTLPLNAVQCPSRQPLMLNLQNIKQLYFYNCSSIITLLTLPIASRMKMLKFLEITECRNLQCIVADEGNAQDHVKYDSFFPNLKRLRVLECQSLKFLFPAQYSFRSLKNLVTLSIWNAPELKYVFGRSNHEYNESLQNQNVQTQVFDLPALESLELEGVLDTFISICPNNYHLTRRSLDKVILNGMPLTTYSTIIKSTDHEGTSEEFAAEIPTPAMEMQALPTSLTGLESSSPSINTREPNYTNQQQALAEVEKDINVSHETNLVIQSTREKTEQGHQEHYATEKVMLANNDLDSRKQYIGSLTSSTSDKESAQSNDHEGTSKELAAEIPTPTFEMQALPTPLTELESTRPSNTGKNSVPEGIISVKTEKVASFIHWEHGDSQLGPYKTSLNEKGKEIVGEFPVSNLPMTTLSLDSEMKKNASPNFLSVLPQEISSHSTNHEEMSEEFAAKIPTQTLAMQALPTSLTESESTRPSNVIQSTRETTEQGHQEHYETEKVTAANNDLDSRKHYIGHSISTLDKESAQTVRETNMSVEGGPDTSLDLAKDKMFHADVISSPHHQSQIGVVGPSTAKNNVQPILGIGEIFQLVELKDIGEVPLLAKALEQYPQLRLSRQQRTNGIIAQSYRVLIDVLALLATKTPSTITTMDKQALEANLDDATILGFDKDWIDTIRAKVVQNDDKSDVHVVEKEILDAEAKIKKCDLDLERVHKRKAEVKECLAQIDDELLSLLEDRMKLVIEMRELEEIKSSKYKPFGF